MLWKAARHRINLIADKTTGAEKAKDGCILAQLFSVHSPINGILARTIAVWDCERNVKVKP
jgi:hypothetical protein